MDVLLCLIQALFGSLVIILMVNTLAKFPNTSFSVFTFFAGLTALAFGLSVDNEFFTFVLNALGSLTLLTGFGNLFLKR